MSEARGKLRQELAGGGLVVAPFVFDGLQARLAEQSGFRAAYVTGFGTAAARGLPDLGLLGASEMAENVRTLAGSVGIPLVCDADTGYGTAINVVRTVRLYERAGAAALHLEDQVWPKRCGFLDGKQVLPLEEVLPKLRAACGERSDPELVIIGRTDALEPEGWDSVERRAHAFLEAGVDLIFVDGIRTRQDLDRYVERLGDLPRVYNGQLESAKEIEDRGFKLMIHPATLGVVFTALRDAFRELADSGRVSAAGDPRAFSELVELMGIRTTLETARKYEA